MKNSALILTAAIFAVLTVVTPSAYAINGTNPRPSAATSPINGTNPRPSAATSDINGTNPRPQDTGVSLPLWAEAVLAVLNLN